MSPQTSYSDTPAAAAIGQVADIGPKDIISGNAALVMPIGRFVTKDGTTYPDRVKLPAAAGDITDLKLARGFVPRTQSNPTNTETDPSYPAQASFPVLKQGRIFVRTEENVTPADAVYIRYTANGAGKVPGQVRKSADTGRAAEATYCRFVGTGSADGLVEVEVDLP